MNWTQQLWNVQGTEGRDIGNTGRMLDTYPKSAYVHGKGEQTAQKK